MTDKRTKANNWHTELERNFYNSAAWHNLSKYSMRRDKYLCQDCLKEGIHTPATEVHHLIPVTDAGLQDEDTFKKYLQADYCISLCAKHHRRRHAAMKHGQARRYVVDPETGDVKPIV